MQNNDMKRDAAARIDYLSRELLRHQYLYYVKARPEISDEAFDALFDELVTLEEAYPDLSWNDSPTKRVGSDLEHDLPEAEHTIPVLSLDKGYSIGELQNWLNRSVKTLERPVSVVLEEKYDGASIVLYYKGGFLERAVTRGNGRVGNDITENVKTIKSVPLQLQEPVDVTVRGEIVLPKLEFADYNSSMGDIYANPRNLAAGVLRSVKSSTVARVPLDIFIYEGFFPEPPQTHTEVLLRLISLGFKINPSVGCFSASPQVLEQKRLIADAAGVSWQFGSLDDLAAAVAEKNRLRSGLPYEIDGLVLKIDELEARNELGYTAHHPRWAIAYKFQAPGAVTRLQGITLQIGRNGRATPVAELDPVQIAGSTVARATLHNQDYIDLMELAVGDTVAVSKRGDVIPAVEKVIEKNDSGNTVWHMPDFCPFCGFRLQKEGAHHFCSNRTCPGRTLNRLIHFTGKTGLDIDGLGSRTVQLLFERGWVKNPADFFSFDYQSLVLEDGFGEKKIAALRQGLEAAKQRPFVRVLTALGLEAVGQRVAALLVENGFDSMAELLQTAQKGDWEALAAVNGIGEVKAKTLIRELLEPENIEIISRLTDAGLKMRAEHLPAEQKTDGSMSGQRWCVTGSFAKFQPRELAMDEVRRRGGAVVSGVSGKTTHLLAGEKAGSKLEKAVQLGITVYNEADFIKLLETDR